MQVGEESLLISGSPPALWVNGQLQVSDMPGVVVGGVGYNSDYDRGFKVGE